MLFSASYTDRASVTEESTKRSLQLFSRGSPRSSSRRTGRAPTEAAA